MQFSSSSGSLLARIRIVEAQLWAADRFAEEDKKLPLSDRNLSMLSQKGVSWVLH